MTRLVDLAAPTSLRPALDELRAGRGSPAAARSDPAGSAPPGFDGPRLWRVDLRDMPVAHQLATLSSSEIARAARFKFEDDRRRYLASHVALRAALAACTGIEPAALEFELGPHDKPGLRPPRAAFNLSHSGDVALIVVAPPGAEWGIDVEVLSKHRDAEEVAGRVFTPGEVRQWQRLPPRERQRGFLQLWTRKEACLKAVGSGLAVEPHRFEAGLADPGAAQAVDAVSRVRLPTPEGTTATVALVDLDAGADVAAALAVRRS